MKTLTPVQKYHNSVIEINRELADILNPAREDVKDFYEKHNEVETKDSKPCGVFENQPEYTANDEVIGNTVIDEVIEQIKNDPIKWGDLQEIAPNQFSVGTGKGNESGRVEIPKHVYPKWINKIESDVKLFFRRSRSKEYYDEESLARGIPRRRNIKKNAKVRSLFVLLDVSGSMWGRSYKGVPLIELMISYFPHIANRFDGEIWQIDDGAPNMKEDLKKLRSKKMRDMALKGGGGTDYNIAFRMINDLKAKLESEGKESEFMTMVFTDGGVYWNMDLIPDNLLIVAPNPPDAPLPKEDKEKNRKIILIDVDND